MLNELEKKQRFFDSFGKFTFEYTRDLSGEIIIHKPKEYTESELATSISEFMFFFMTNTYHKLNDFIGINNVKFKF